MNLYSFYIPQNSSLFFHFVSILTTWCLLILGKEAKQKKESMLSATFSTQPAAECCSYTEIMSAICHLSRSLILLFSTLHKMLTYRQLKGSPTHGFLTSCLQRYVSVSSSGNRAVATKTCSSTPSSHTDVAVTPSYSFCSRCRVSSTCPAWAKETREAQNRNTRQSF